mgnify:CR=1 FL=1|jgi:hypothetical protein
MNRILNPVLRIFVFSLFFASTQGLYSAPLVSGHLRLGLGVEKWPENSAGFDDQATIGQLSFDFKTPFNPIHYALDFSGTVKEKGRYSVPGTLGELETTTRSFSFGPRYYHDLGPVDVYGGVSLTYLKTEQKLSATGVIRNLSDDGLGSTLVLGLSDLEVFLPKIGWGIEYRMAWIDVDALIDIQPKEGTWLLTTGIKW